MVPYSNAYAGQLDPEHPVMKDFRNFLYLVWKHLNLPVPTPVQYDIAWNLQHGPRRFIIEAFRGVGKSWVTSAFVCWLLLKDPQTKIMVVSASKDRSDAFSQFTKRLIAEMPVLQHLQPKGDQRDSNIAFDVGPALADHSPSVKSVGITGQLTGSRADVIVADDIETPKNSLTQTMRDRLAELVKEFDAVLKPSGRIIYLGTPQTEMSLYNRMPERGYQIMVWPARIPALEKLENYQGRLAPYVHKLIEGGAKPRDCVDPDRFDDLDLREREASYGRSGFALQFMLDTTLSDAERYPLKLADFIVMDLDKDIAPVKAVWAGDPENIVKDIDSVGFTGDYWHKPMHVSEKWEEYTGSVMFIDPSGRGADHTGYAVVKYLNGMLYLVAAGGLSGGYDTATLETLARIGKTHKVNLTLIEDNFGDGMYTQLYKPVQQRIHQTTIEEVHSVGQKELRIIDTLEPVLNQHRLVVDRSILLEDMKHDDVNYQLFHQLTRITKERNSISHDDALEAVAGAVRHWVNHMNRSTENAEEEHKQKLLEAELAAFMETVIGRTPGNPNALGLDYD